MDDGGGERDALVSAAVSDVAALRQPRLRHRVPARKWAQLNAFASAMRAEMEAGSTILDWCAGKGHLGRTLGAVTGQPVTSVERQAALCQQGVVLAERLGVAYEAVCADVLEASTWSVLAEDQVAVALHACGALTDTLLEHAASRGVATVVTAMCCYHYLGHAKKFIPRSRAGRAAGLALTPGQLRLAIFDEVVAPPRERRLRRRAMAWRAGVDALVREATGVDRYTSLGVIPTGWFKKDFQDFVEAVARRDGLALPPRWDADAAEQAGWTWSARAQALGWLRGRFRRPLELWLQLDRALRQLELGRVVTVSEFCARALTPRNVLLVSRRHGG